jgi:hypothetical protein
MKKQILDYSGADWHAQQLSCVLSFQPFLNWLRQRAAEEKTAKRFLYEKAVERFEAESDLPADIPVEEIFQYAELLEWMYACITQAAQPEEEIMWSLWVPARPLLFYGTDAFYELIQQHKIDLNHRSPEDFRREQLQMVYTFILRKLYHFHPRLNEYYHAYLNPATGLLQYYTIHINTKYIDVTTDGPLPPLDLRNLTDLLQEGAGYEVLENILPLHLFRFRGISVSTITDVTAQRSLENLRQIRLTQLEDETGDGYHHLIRSLKTLVRSNKIEFDLFPMVQINGKYVYGYEMGGSGILYSVWGDKTLTPAEFQAQASAYATNPRSFFMPDIHQEDLEKNKWLTHFMDFGVRSLATTPVFFEGTMVGTICMYTQGDDQFDERTLALLETALPSIAQLLQVFIDAFNQEINNIIREKYTSIQPAVQWKFREAAWSYLYQTKKQLPPTNYTIQFDALYPLYGAVDIRNSSVERNKAIKADLGAHLQLLHKTLTSLQPLHQSSLTEQMFYTIGKWQKVLDQEVLTASDEASLNYFLNEEISAWLDHLKVQHTQSRDIIGQYRKLIQGTGSLIFNHRHALETSMQTINNAIGIYLDGENVRLQQIYPCYFEKFRTDGLEYDCYLGQSIAPDKPFDHFYLKDFRLWQLSSMTAIARLTHALLPQMPVALCTTQLIFVHDQTIDISFRTDERRFDVEGAYNIRYEMIKKRIDKVHIRNTDQRLTQPDTLAIIYFNRNDLYDYLPHIKYLQETGVLMPDLEELELEDLQGITGLRALRIGIVY